MRAVWRLQELLAKPAAGDDVVVALGVLGDAFDALGRVDDAFAAYAAAKARVAARHGPDARPAARMEAERVTVAVGRAAARSA